MQALTGRQAVAHVAYGVTLLHSLQEGAKHTREGL